MNTSASCEETIENIYADTIFYVKPSMCKPYLKEGEWEGYTPETLTIYFATQLQKKGISYDFANGSANEFASDIESIDLKGLVYATLDESKQNQGEAYVIRLIQEKFEEVAEGL